MWSIGSSVALHIGILERHLTICEQLLGHLLANHELTLAVAHCDRVQIANLERRQPRRSCSADAGRNNLRDVTVDIVVEEGRRLLGHHTELSVWQQSRLNECLEAVADTQNQATTLNQSVNSLGYGCVIQYTCNELTRTIRLITQREATTQYKDIALVDSLGHSLDRLQDILRCEVTEYSDMGLCALTLECTSSVVVAVCTREYRQVNLHLLNLLALILWSLGSAVALTALLARLTLCRVDLLELSTICYVELLQRELLAQYLDALLSGSFTHLDCALERLLSLDQNRTIRVVEQGCLVAGQYGTNLVTERHLGNCLRYATKADCIARKDIALLNLGSYSLEVSL